MTNLIQLILLTIILCTSCYASELPVFDAHTHYSHDVWDAIPPDEAIKRLRSTGISNALVSSASDEGTQRLYQLAPNFVIPSLSPYLRRGANDIWMDDESVIAYLEQQLAVHTYVAIGEFHVYGDDAVTPVVERVVELAHKHNLMLHAHSDPEAIRLMFDLDPEAEIIWAHAGFEDADVVREMLEQYPNLWADLSVRKDIYTKEKGFLEEWRQLLIDHSDRFMLGLDTYTPQRWLQINSIMARQLDLLNALPEQVAENIRYRNGERIVMMRFRKKLQQQPLNE